METRRWVQGLRQAMRDYTRLCADPNSGPLNQVSGAAMIREQLGYSPRIAEILSILADVPAPVSVADLTEAMDVNPDSSVVGTLLWQLHGYGLVARIWENVPTGGRKALYELSPLGRLVMGKGLNDDGPPANIPGRVCDRPFDGSGRD